MTINKMSEALKAATDILLDLKLKQIIAIQNGNEDEAYNIFIEMMNVKSLVFNNTGVIPETPDVSNLINV